MIIKTNRIEQVCYDLIDEGIKTEVKNDYIILPLDIRLQTMITFLSDYRPGIVTIDISMSAIHMVFPE